MADRRFDLVRDRNSVDDVSYITSRYTSLELWQERAAELREQVLVSTGLVPMPERTALNPAISCRIERDGYSVEKVHFQSFPGFYVTGNLYRPLSKGPHPGILNPHGHWKAGRLENNDVCSVPGRCINFAKQGYVAFSYDMVDYVDSKQWPHQRWDLRDRLWGVSAGGLQLWNSIRALDFLQSLPDVDAERIACTGASGGGTQTFLLCAVDDRVKVSAPVNMISAHMHGGCFCENPPGLRIDTNNVEIAALMAPRPMIMVCATGDWTKNNPSLEFPTIRHIYSLFGADEKIQCVQVDAGHNYNKESREAVYTFFGRWLPTPYLGPGFEIPPQHKGEQPFKVERDEDLRVFPNGMPKGALDADGIVKRAVDEGQFSAIVQPGREEAEKAYRSAMARALALPSKFEVEAEVLSQETDVDISTKRVLIREMLRGAEIAAVVVEPANEIAPKTALVVDGPLGRPMMDSGGVRHLVEHSWRIVSIEAVSDESESDAESRPVRDVNKDFFDTYNRTDTQERVYEIVTAALWASREADRVALIGTGLGGPWCMLAAPYAEAVTEVAADMSGVDVTSDEALVRDVYVPCLRRLGDFRTARTLCPPRRMICRDLHPNPMDIAKWLCEEQR